MVQIVFETRGQRIAIEVEPGGSVMQAAVAHNVPGIDADCGGSMVCGTCHVYLDAAWLARLPPKSEMEQQILDYVPEPRPDTRLSCQIAVSEAIDGLLAVVPPAQR